MQSVQYVSYSLLELTTSTYKVCTKGHQNNPQTPRILSRQDRARTVLKFLDPPLRDMISPKSLTFEAVNAVDMCKFAPIHRDGDDLV